ncbi:TetR/AcrR family transcriptional regulator [Glycomyces algeriensis]|uniref:TetR family transcriptional regulator n=1 Tax=Glycomyces algeriensis TaxID=256037 RepID=A0A9W6LGN3_9ACTN|nr:TetR/AcrR family transcriptional regulator [Glycomyces algeriensis]MDA1365285.1 TetR/AcrR family transcriptional regulator [Glycomyces algeriensis]MDR7349651.1 AcrR family transcriptional regulator [Glycomyces algeriensis]GLI42360.1 TetR family transcriptional regulator [Glycomyces algeriensis]
MTSNTAGGPSRRERMRAETIAEIKASARGQLLQHGPSGISLRAIAREVGVTPAALYRYFDSLDALLIQLVCDLYDELIAATRAAMDEAPPEAHLDRMKAWVWAFRAWSVGNRREFELMISYPEGNSAMSICADPKTIDSLEFDAVTLKSMEHAQLCGRELAQFYRQTEGEGFEFGSVTLPEMSDGLQQELIESCSLMIIGERLPVSWVFAFTSAWVRVFGLVTMEAFGSLPVQNNIDEFYKAQIKSMLRDFGMEQ